MKIFAGGAGKILGGLLVLAAAISWHAQANRYKSGHYGHVPWILDQATGKVTYMAGTRVVELTPDGHHVFRYAWLDPKLHTKDDWYSALPVFWLREFKEPNPRIMIDTSDLEYINGPPD